MGEGLSNMYQICLKGLMKLLSTHVRQIYRSIYRDEPSSPVFLLLHCHAGMMPNVIKLPYALIASSPHLFS